MPAGTVTVSWLAPGKRGAVEVNERTRVSSHRHWPGIAGEIDAGGLATAPTCATATIGSANRIRTSAWAPAGSSPRGEICGAGSGAGGALGAGTAILQPLWAN